MAQIVSPIMSLYGMLTKFDDFWQTDYDSFFAVLIPCPMYCIILVLIIALIFHLPSGEEVAFTSRDYITRPSIFDDQN